jgi:hypothetical protein
LKRPTYKEALAQEYDTRVISLSFEEGTSFTVMGARFSFRMTKCPRTGKPVLRSKIRFPDGTSKGADHLVLLVRGNKPCRDVPFGRGDGKLEVYVPDLIVVTRLAVRDIKRPRHARKYAQELRRAAKAAENN